ncbi:unnamed protein product, partial [marine sediment metagenome]
EKNLKCDICDNGRLYNAQGLAGHMRLKHQAGSTPNIDRTTSEARIDEETRQLANQVRRGKLNDELEELAGRRRRRERVEDLELREREAQLHQGPGAGQGSGELKELRTEVATLRESLHQQQLDQINTKVDRLTSFIAESDKRKVGRTELDLMSEGLGKVENLISLGGEKVDHFLRDHKDEQHLLRSLSFGIAPGEYEHLLRGQEEIIPFEDYCLSMHIRAARAKEEYQEPTREEYQEYVKRQEATNRKYQAISDRVTKKL